MHLPVGNTESESSIIILLLLLRSKGDSRSPLPAPPVLASGAPGGRILMSSACCRISSLPLVILPVVTSTIVQWILKIILNLTIQSCVPRRNDANIGNALIGELQWLVALGRIDVMYTVNVLSRFRPAPRRGHLERVKRVHAFLKQYRKTAIKFNSNRRSFIFTMFWVNSIYVYISVLFRRAIPLYYRSLTLCGTR